jgi:FAD/FMN-containing dehydrogenase
MLTETLVAASDRGIVADAVVASSLGQARDFWLLRESYSEAQKPLGASVKNDVSVPVNAIPEFIRRADAAMERICPGARPIPISHFGDGNIHYNIAQPEGMARDRFMALWDDMVHAVHEVVLDLNGSISAEHGIGVMKRAELAQAKGAVAMDLMHKIKAAFDPKGILNPGKVL